ncbi:MAG: hypothetical protein SCARUB_04516 [Candidatus Scalindua rubra]|uniref:Uncharacterized protein n=1 Tax=Candidatus Scalindua rubra TaxID=1872076 RepID=A0A1E3X495_9BACT|nr:MAG: hypothetical protein SCARUB_04516 [Candidatus Scalindua rubra]
MSIFKLWTSTGTIYRGTESFLSGNPSKLSYTSPPDFEKDVAALQDFREHIPSPRMVKPDTFKRILNDVFEHPLILHAFWGNDGKVVCMDGGIVGNHLHMGGSGILLPRKKYGIPTDPIYQIIQQLCSQEGYNIPFSHDIDILLPENKYIENFQSLCGRGILKRITSHQNCGAAKVDIKRILLNTEEVDIPEDIIEKILNNLPQRVIEEHAKLFSKTLSIKLGIPDAHIPEEQMERLPHIHREKIVYIDLIGGTDPYLTFCFRKLELPDGFILHPFLSDWENIFERLEVGLSITFSAHGRGDEFSKENPFFVVLIDHPVYRIIEKNPEIPREIQNRINKLDLEDRILIHTVTPNIQFKGVNQ